MCFSSKISFCSCGRLKGKLRGEWETDTKGGEWVRWEEKRVVLCNLAEAVRRRSLGRNVCWCILFELLTDWEIWWRQSRTGHAAQQMTRQCDCCRGDWQHGWPNEWPKPCLRSRNQCDIRRGLNWLCLFQLDLMHTSVGNLIMMVFYCLSSIFLLLFILSV